MFLGHIAVGLAAKSLLALLPTFATVLLPPLGN
jgi:hypothetical protein